MLLTQAPQPILVTGEMEILIPQGTGQALHWPGGACWSEEEFDFQGLGKLLAKGFTQRAQGTSQAPITPAQVPPPAGCAQQPWWPQQLSTWAPALLHHKLCV